MSKLVRVLGVLAVAVIAACAIDSGPERQEDTLGRWADAIPGIAPMVVDMGETRFSGVYTKR